MTIFSFVGCSGGSGGAGSTGDAGRYQAKSKEEALGKLSANHRQNFEGWKKQIVKACDASQAFGLRHVDRVEFSGIDGAALIQANGGSVVFENNGRLAVLNSYDSFPGIGNSKSEESISDNGQSYTISVETKRSGSNCEVYLYGQKVYETAVMQSFTIGAEWTPGKQAQASSIVNQVQALGGTGLAEIVQPEVYSLISQTIRPSKEAISLIAQKLKIDEKVAPTYFKVGNFASASTATRISNEPAAVWTNTNDRNLIASVDLLKNLFDGSARTLPLEVRVGVANFTFGKIKNSNDAGNLKLAFDVAVTRKEQTNTYSTKSIELLGLERFNEKEALTCARDRAAAYIVKSTGRQIQPSVQSVLEPCEVLFPEVQQASFNRGLMKSLISRIFGVVILNSYASYNGWDEVLTKLALKSLEDKKDIRSELDPNGSSSAIATLANYMQNLDQEIPLTKNLNLARESILRMGAGWAFAGITVPQSRIKLILESTDNSIVTFRSSTERLFRDLAQRPNDFDDVLNFARGLDDSYKAEAMKAQNLSAELAYGEFANDVFNQILQRRTSVDELKTWSANFTVVKASIAKYSNLGPVKGQLVGVSLKWLKSREVNPLEVDSVYSALDNSTAPFEVSSQTLVKDLAQSYGGNKVGIEYARSITPEYKQLAIAIRDNSKAAAYESWGASFFSSVLQKRPTIEQLRAWNEMWSASLAFTQREKARTVDELGSTNEWNRQKVMEVAVKETWSNADFAALEIIAEVARTKNGCDRSKGLSSLAECGGMSLFSKQKGMFFDPVFSGRYVNLGRDFTQYFRQLAAFDHISLRWTLVDGFFSIWRPIWSNCSNDLFSTKAANLKTQVNALAHESDQFKKWELERMIKETIGDCH